MKTSDAIRLLVTYYNALMPFAVALEEGHIVEIKRDERGEWASVESITFSDEGVWFKFSNVMQSVPMHSIATDLRITRKTL